MHANDKVRVRAPAWNPGTASKHRQHWPHRGRRCRRLRWAGSRTVTHYVTEVEPVHDTRGEILGDDVGPLNKPLHHLARAGVLQIQRDRLGQGIGRRNSKHRTSAVGWVFRTGSANWGPRHRNPATAILPTRKCKASHTRPLIPRGHVCVWTSQAPGCPWHVHGMSTAWTTWTTGQQDWRARRASTSLTLLPRLKSSNPAK